MPPSSSSILFISLLFLLFSLPTIASAQEITVSAAASLKDAFTDAAKQFEQENKGTKVNLNFAGSGKLMQQILNGAPVDLFASADTLRMDRIASAQLILTGTRKNIAKNQLVLIAPKNTTLQVTDLSQLITSPIVKKIAIAKPDSVPAGRYTKIALDKQKLYEKLSEKIIPTQDVRQALDYVARGEVDAGFVYKTDAHIMKDKVKILYQVQLDSPPTYPITIINTTKSLPTAKRFLSFITGPKGQGILKKYGFSEPVNKPKSHLLSPQKKEH